MTGSVRLQPLTRARMTSLGERGADWAERLPGVLAGLARDWGLDLGRALPGGSNSYVVARRRGGRLCGCGQGRPRRRRSGRSGSGCWPTRPADGATHGCCGPTWTGGALLLEALGAPLQASGRSSEDQLRVLADTLAVAWQPSPLDRVPTEADKAVGLAGLVTDHWERLGRPCPVAVRDQALRYADLLADAPGESLVVVHGDAHPGNALAVPRPRSGAETGYCFVDPDGFVADRAYDLGVTMRDFSATVLREGRPTGGVVRAAARRPHGVDATRIWRWAFLERVSTGLYVLGFGAEAVARPYLDSAAVLLD